MIRWPFVRRSKYETLVREYLELQQLALEQLATYRELREKVNELLAHAPTAEIINMKDHKK